MQLLIDSSVFISFLGKEDEYTPPSKKFFSFIAPHAVRILLPTLVIAETLVILSQQGQKDIPRILKRLMDLEVIALDTLLVTYMEDLLKAIKISLKTSDFIIAATARKYDVPLITWDSRLLSNKNTICTAVSPSRYIAGLKN